jgi:hypothetical protein
VVALAVAIAGGYAIRVATSSSAAQPAAAAARQAPSAAALPEGCTWVGGHRGC